MPCRSSKFILLIQECAKVETLTTRDAGLEPLKQEVSQQEASQVVDGEEHLDTVGAFGSFGKTDPCVVYQNVQALIAILKLLGQSANLSLRGEIGNHKSSEPIAPISNEMLTELGTQLQFKVEDDADYSADVAQR